MIMLLDISCQIRKQTLLSCQKLTYMLEVQPPPWSCLAKEWTILEHLVVGSGALALYRQLHLHWAAHYYLKENDAEGVSVELL